MSKQTRFLHWVIKVMKRIYADVVEAQRQYLLYNRSLRHYPSK